MNLGTIGHLKISTYAKSFTIKELLSFVYSFCCFFTYTARKATDRLAASCRFYWLAESCQQVAARQLNSSYCSKSVKIN